MINDINTSLFCVLFPKILNARSAQFFLVDKCLRNRQFLFLLSKSPAYELALLTINSALIIQYQSCFDRLPLLHRIFK